MKIVSTVTLDTMKTTQYVPLLYLALLPLLQAYHQPILQADYQQFTSTPENITASLGGMVVLKCRLSSRPNMVQWTKGGLGLGVGRNLPHYPRFTMTGDDLETDWDLTISPVTLEDHDKFQCQAAPLASPAVWVHVNIPPSKPNILQGDQVNVIEERPQHLTCQSEGRPKPEIEWEGVRGKVLGWNSSSTWLESNIFLTTSIITFIPNSSQDKTEITCQARNSASNKGPASSSTKIRLKYKPRMRLSQAGSVEKAREREDLHLRCQVDAHPPPSLISWYINGKPLGKENGQLLTIQQVNRDFHGARVRCVASNELGRVEQQIKLQFSFGPVISRQPENVMAVEGEEVTFDCQAKSNPPPTYSWTWMDKKVVGTTPTLTINAENDTAGDYTCHAVLEGFPPTSSQAAHLYIISKPVIEMKEDHQGQLGGQGILECQVHSLADSLTIRWDRGGRPLSGDHDIRITKEQEVETSELVLHGLELADFGEYGCTAENNLGEARQITNLLQTESGIGSTTMYILVISLLVLTLLLMAIILYILYSKRSRSNKKEDISAQNPPVARNRFGHPDVLNNGEGLLKPSRPPVAKNRFGQPDIINSDEALLKDLLNTRVKGVDEGLLVPTFPRHLLEGGRELDQQSARSSLLSSKDEELMFTDDKILTPGYYCQLGTADSTSPSIASGPTITSITDSGVHSNSSGPSQSDLGDLGKRVGRQPSTLKRMANLEEEMELFMINHLGDKVETSV